MYAACFTVTLYIPGASSLKDRRSVVSSLKQRLRGRFNISVIDCSEDGKWQTGRLSIAAAALCESAARQIRQNVIEFIERDCRADIIDIATYEEGT